MQAYLHIHACAYALLLSLVMVLSCQLIGNSAAHARQLLLSQKFLKSYHIWDYIWDCTLCACRYQEAVRLHPGCPAEVRLGLAACYFRLGQLERARKAYERVVQLNPTCAEALYGLAVLRFSSSQGESPKAVSAGHPVLHAACSTMQTATSCDTTHSDLHLLPVACHVPLGQCNGATLLMLLPVLLQACANGLVPVQCCCAELMWVIHCPMMQSYREGLQLLCQAYDSDPRNPAVLNLLAHYCLTRKEYTKVLSTAPLDIVHCLQLLSSSISRLSDSQPSPP